jgi:hypothetical protein
MEFMIDISNANTLLCNMLEARARNGLVTTPEQFSQLRSSAANGTAMIFKDVLYRPIGYIAWANVNKESILRLSTLGKFPCYPYEWNEGGVFLLLDVVFDGDSRRYGLSELKRVLSTKRAVVFSKRKSCRLYLKRKGNHRRIQL